MAESHSLGLNPVEYEQGLKAYAFLRQSGMPVEHFLNAGLVHAALTLATAKDLALSGAPVDTATLERASNAFDAAREAVRLHHDIAGLQAGFLASLKAQLRILRPED